MNDGSTDSECRVSFQFDESGAEATDSMQPTAATRRHTISLKLRQEDAATPPPNENTEFSRPKLSPPDVILDSLYSVVDKKSKRYPAPNMPAPPPPYEGKAMKDVAKKPSPSSEPPPSSEQVDTASKRPERSISPPGYEPVSSINAAGGVGPPKIGGGSARLPPSRPSRPPAGNLNV